MTFSCLSRTKFFTLQLLKQLPEKIFDKRESDSIYQEPFSIKARALLYAHLHRLHERLNQNTQLCGIT